MKKTITILFLAMLCAACSMTGNSVCDKYEPGQSQLCDVADRSGVTLEDVGNGLIVANALAIGEGLYSKEQAFDVLVDIRQLVSNPVSYRAVSKQISAAIHKYPGLFVVGMVYLQQMDSTRIMSQNDAGILRGWLDRQIEALGKV